MASEVYESYYKGDFHRKHGINLRLSQNLKTVTVVNSPILEIGHRYVFSSRPIAIGEKIHLLIKVDGNIDKEATIVIGFACRCPNTIQNPKDFMDQYYNITDLWTEILQIDTKRMPMRLWYTISNAGWIRYKVNNSKIVRIKPNSFPVVQPLWAFISIGGNSTTVSIIDPASQTINPAPELPIASPFPTAQETANNTNQKVPMPLVSFHQVCQFCTEPLQPYQIVHMEIHEKNYTSTVTDAVIFGITSTNPRNVFDIPSNQSLKNNEVEGWYTIEYLQSHDIAKGDQFMYHIDRTKMYSRSNNRKPGSERRSRDVMGEVWPFLKITGESCKVIMYLEDPITLDTSQEKGQFLDDSSCTVCYENDVNAVLVPCGHMHLCYDCADKLKMLKDANVCPICRQAIESVVKVYK